MGYFVNLPVKLTEFDEETLRLNMDIVFETNRFPELRDAVRWCSSKCIGKWNHLTTYRKNCTFWFELREDALNFKLEVA